ncbi:TetR/AcrR family transcriptional regulator [Nocardia harenae]|uniref:TetR/AcrR family transcriptional regulator n=1 Tax=Nocardia harenae TaxID=358707 RepID=UPI00083700F8|nr:TetR/AcrR family transcriptional regulator [Nocardia harenae]
MTEPTPSLRHLPRGRHGLPREQVVASQRERILSAMAEAMVEYGYIGTSVAAILKRAGVSRETFYEQFRSKEHCFEATYERAVTLLLDKIERAAAMVDDPETVDERTMRSNRMDRILEAYLDHLVDDPASARVFLVEVFAVGSPAVARRAELQRLFVELLAEVLDVQTDAQMFACAALAAAIGGMVTGRIAAGDMAGVRALRAPLLDLVHRGGVLYGNAFAEPARR